MLELREFIQVEVLRGLNSWVRAERAVGLAAVADAAPRWLSVVVTVLLICLYAAPAPAATTAATATAAAVGPRYAGWAHVGSGWDGWDSFAWSLPLLRALTAGLTPLSCTQHFHCSLLAPTAQPGPSLPLGATARCVPYN